MSKHADLVFAAVASAEANSSLIASWRRCVVTHALHPDQAHKPARDTDALREALQRDALMMTVAQPIIHEFQAALTGVNAVVMLADRNGLVLSQHNGRFYDHFRRPPSANVGVRFAEKDIGTGPIGTVLVEERAMMFAPGECFSQDVEGLSCMGAPIFGPDGQVVGVLACGHTEPTADAQALDKLLFMLISQCARRIGLEMFAKTFPQATLLQVPAGGASGALIAVGTDDTVLGATRGARRLLGLSDADLDAPLSIRDLFGTPQVHDLAAAEAKLIAQTMVRYAYNRSAVAKALGISRSTLYRKLRALKSSSAAQAQEMLAGS